MATATVLSLAGCVDIGAPPGATVAVFLSSDILQVGTSTVGVRILITEESGDPVRDGTRATVFATLGGFCFLSEADSGSVEGSTPLCDAMSVPPSVRIRTTNGTVDLRYRSPLDTGLAIIRARSGDATAEDTVTVLDLD